MCNCTPAPSPSVSAEQSDSVAPCPDWCVWRNCDRPCSGEHSNEDDVLIATGHYHPNKHAIEEGVLCPVISVGVHQDGPPAYSHSGEASVWITVFGLDGNHAEVYLRVDEVSRLLDYLLRHMRIAEGVKPVGAA